MNGAAGGDGVGWKRGSLKGVRFPPFFENGLGKVRYFFKKSSGDSLQLCHNF